MRPPLTMRLGVHPTVASKQSCPERDVNVRASRDDLSIRFVLAKLLTWVGKELGLASEVRDRFLWGRWNVPVG